MLPCVCSVIDHRRCQNVVKTKTLCLHTQQPGTVLKKLDTRQSEILINFLGIASLIPLRTQDICLEISSDCKYCLRLKVEATVEFGHRVKSQCV